MKKLLALIAAISFSLLANLSVSAQPSHQVGIELNGIFIPQFTAKENFRRGKTDKGDINSALGGGAAVVFRMSDLIRLGVGFDYLPLRFKDSDAKVDMIPVTGTFRLGGLVDDMLYLYGGAGLGISFNKVTWPTGYSDSGNCWIIYLCGGAEISLNEEIALRGEVRYSWAKQELDYGGWTGKSDLHLDHLQLRAGLIIWF